MTVRKISKLPSTLYTWYKKRHDFKCPLVTAPRIWSQRYFRLLLSQAHLPLQWTCHSATINKLKNTRHISMLQSILSCVQFYYCENSVTVTMSQLINVTNAQHITTARYFQVRSEFNPEAQEWPMQSVIYHSITTSWYLYKCSGFHDKHYSTEWNSDVYAK